MNSGFLITDAGLAVASTASPTGPKINIASFKVGSGVNYTPTRSQTALAGSVLYTGVPSGVAIVDADTLEVMLMMDATVGPFKFGEAGIYLDTGTLFAVCVWDTLQDQVKAVGLQAGTVYKIRARIKLAQAPAICNVTLNQSPALLEVPNWTLLQRPQDQIMGHNAAIIHDNNDSDDPVLVVRDTGTEWAPVGYRQILESYTTDGGASATTSSYTHPDIPSIGIDNPTNNSKYLIKLPQGEIRKIATISGNTVTWTNPISAVPNGLVRICESNSQGSISWVNKNEWNEVITAFNGFWGNPTGTYPLSNKGLAQTTLLPLAGGPPSAAQVAQFVNAWDKYAIFHNIDDSRLVTEVVGDFRAGLNGNGMEAMRRKFDIVKDVVAQAWAKRNYVNSGPLIPLPVVSQSDPAFWTPSRTYTYELVYSSNTVLDALINVGHFISVTRQVSSISNPDWGQLQSLFTQMGTFYLHPGRAVSSVTNDHTKGLGYLTGSYQTMETFNNGAWICTVLAKRVSNVVTIQIVLDNSGTGPTDSGSSPGSINFSLYGYVPLSSLLNSPVLNAPVCTPPPLPLTFSPNPLSVTHNTGASVDDTVTYAPTGTAVPTLISGSLPAGLSVTTPNTSQVKLTGTVTASAGIYTSTWSITTAGGSSGSLTITVNVGTGFSIVMSNWDVVAVSDGSPGPGSPITAGISFQNDGTLRGFSPGRFDILHPTNWVAEKPISSSNAGLYEIRVQLNPETNTEYGGHGSFLNRAPQTGPALNTWLPLNTTRTWTNTDTPPDEFTLGAGWASKLDVFIRVAATGVIVSSATYRVMAWQNSSFNPDGGGGGD